jgi:hypothetical protein
VYRGGLHLSIEPLHAGFGITVEKLQGFLVFRSTTGMLSASRHAAEPVQIAHFNKGQGGAGC